MQLSYSKVAAARACGIEFPPASPAQVQRLSMQRKVFEIDGQPHLATRDGSFFETAGTLERLIAGEVETRQQADLAAWEAGGTAEPSPAPVSAQAAPEPAEQRDKLEDAKAALRAEMERRAAELGLSASDLFAQTARQETTGQGTRRRRPRSDAGAKRAVAVRYRGPGGEEWSGRGRTPRWLVAQEAEGRNREEFAVEPKLGLP